MRKEFSKTAAFSRRFFQAAVELFITQVPQHKTRSRESTPAHRFFLNLPGKKTPKPKIYGEY